MELQSARLLIRPWRRHDEDQVERWPPYNDPLEPLWNLPRQVPLPIEHWGSFELFGIRRTWAVEDSRGRLAGRISLREVNERAGQARLGITFGAPYVGQGLGSEALARFLDYYFGELGFQAMVLDVAAPNQRAVRCYERLRFRRVGSDWRYAGSYFDTRILQRPNYAHLAEFFRPSQRRNGLEVLFFEMELQRAEWLPPGP